MAEVSTIGLDIAKAVFHAHGADARGQMVFSRRLTRAKLLEFFAAQPRCVFALEAYGGTHHWAREIASLEHEVKLIPPAYVKPFVKRNKNDAVDAEAICEAAQRPSLRYAAIKTEAQQAAGIVFRTRDLLVRQRTQLINAIRGHLTEFGWVAPKGPSRISVLASLLEEGEEIGASPTIRRELRRRNTIEPIIGHTKSDGLLERNHLAGTADDAINAILVAAGHNLRLLIVWLTALLRALIAACVPRSWRKWPPPEQDQLLGTGQTADGPSLTAPETNIALFTGDQLRTGMLSPTELERQPILKVKGVQKTMG